VPPSMMETLLTRVWENAVAYGTQIVPWSLTVPTIGGTPIDNVLTSIVLFAACGFGAWQLRRRAPLAMLYVIVYAALLLVWPWNAWRFVWPMVPLLVWAMIEGLVSIGAYARLLKPLAALAAVALLATAISRDVVMIRDARTCFRTDARESASCYTAMSRGFFRVGDFLRDSTPKLAIVVSGHEALLAYHSERSVLSSLAIGGRTPPATFALMRQRNAEYVVLTRLREPAPQLVPTMTQGCRELEVVREYDETLLLRLPEPGAMPGKNACDALVRYSSTQSDRRVIR
jgi:hypothetical protein